jgi:serpin B
VSESETEAAADTIGVMLSSNGKQTGYPKPTFHADHPFVYLIQEASSGAIFFIGTYQGN